MATAYITVRVDGLQKLRRIAADLKTAADGKQIRRDLLRGLRAAAKPMPGAAERAARDELPHEGGLNEWVADSKFAVRNRVSVKGASIRVVGTKRGHDLNAINKGIVRHPVFGHKEPDRKWAVTFVDEGFWDRAMRPLQPRASREIHEVIDDIAARIG